MNAIETQGLSRRFRRHLAVQDVTLTVPCGGVAALLGANGAGKSTLLKLILGLLPASAGRAIVMGRSTLPFPPEHWQEVAYVSENLALPRHLRLADYLARWRPLYPQWDEALERELLDLYALPLDRRLGAFSRGMQLKVQLLSVLPFRPRLMVMDEPLSGLDPMVREQVVQSLSNLVATHGSTLLISSHDVNEVESLVDHVFWLHEGRLRLDEPVESLQRRFRRVVLDDAGPTGEPNLPPSAGAVERAGRCVQYIDADFTGAPPAAVVMPLSLRDIFLHLLREPAAAAAPRASSVATR